MKKIHIKDLNNQGSRFTAVAVVRDGAKDLFSEVITASTKDEFDSKAADMLKRADSVAVEFAKLSAGEWVAPAPRVKTKEEEDKESYEVGKINLLSLKEDLEIGLISDAEYEAALSTFKLK